MIESNFKYSFSLYRCIAIDLIDRHAIKLAHLSGERHGNGLDLGVSLQAVLAQLAPRATLLEATKGRSGRKDVIAVKPGRVESVKA